MTSSPSLLPPIRWPAEAIWEAVAPLLPGFTVEVLPEIDSTNSELMRRFKGGPGTPPQREPLLLVAEQQSAGRGRLGRSWQGRRGDSLTFSLGLPLQPADWSGLSLAVGISVAESLEPPEAGQARHAGQPRIGLKWPNDLWLSTPQGERKLAGILVETASWDGLRYVVIGVGVNIRPVALADSADDAPGRRGARRPAGAGQRHRRGRSAAAHRAGAGAGGAGLRAVRLRAVPGALRGCATCCPAARCSCRTAPGARPTALPTTARCACIRRAAWWKSPAPKSACGPWPAGASAAVLRALVLACCWPMRLISPGDRACWRPMAGRPPVRPNPSGWRSRSGPKPCS